MPLPHNQIEFAPHARGTVFIINVKIAVVL